MRKSDLAAEVAEVAGLSVEQATAVVDQALVAITTALSADQTVSLVGFGSFVKRHRAARQGKNPRTGETIQVPASNTVGFKPGKAFKEALN